LSVAAVSVYFHHVRRIVMPQALAFTALNSFISTNLCYLSTDFSQVSRFRMVRLWATGSMHTYLSDYYIHVSTKNEIFSHGTLESFSLGSCGLLWLEPVY